jgi:diacylglycerol kinase
MFQKVGKGIWSYLKDWKNLLAHTLVGVALLLIALFLPVKPVFRIVILLLVVCFNMLRMQLAKSKERTDDQAARHL